MAVKRNYPEWVEKYHEKGMVIKKIDGSYYLYKRTSKRFPGKKYPQPVDVIQGEITRDGVIYSEETVQKLQDALEKRGKNLSSSSNRNGRTKSGQRQEAQRQIEALLPTESTVKEGHEKASSISSQEEIFAEVYEYGFSYVMLQICPPEWKIQLKNDWEDVLTAIICQQSPLSCLRNERTVKSEKELHYPLDLLTASLSRNLARRYGMTIKDMDILQQVFVIHIGDVKYYTKLSTRQEELIRKFGIEFKH